MPSEPLYPHVPKSRQPQFPHVSKGKVDWAEGKLLFQQSVKRDGVLYQVWERARYTPSRIKIVRGEIRPYINWIQEAEEDWPIMLSDGFIYYSIYPEEKEGRILDIMTTIRRIGLGRNLVAVAEERMRQYGVIKVSGSSHPSQQVARAFWSNMGYTFQDSEMQKTLLWGKDIEKLPQVTIEGGGPVPPQYRHLVSLVSEPLPKDAY